MFLRQRLLVVVFMVSLLLLGATYSEAGLWDTKNIPVPGDTVEVKQEKRNIAATGFIFTYYTSTQDAAALKSFYRQRLPAQGWKERELLKDLDKIPNFKAESALSESLEKAMVFEKDNRMLMINFMPEGFFKDNKTYYTVGESINALNTAPALGADFLPNLLTKPKKDVAPVYPDANLVSLVEDANNIRAVYFAKDNIEEVAKFYKEKMPGYGWVLTAETPIKEISIGEAGSYNVAEVKPPQTFFAELVFSNERGDDCRIGFSYQASEQKLAGVPEYTTVMVNYAGKR